MILTPKAIVSETNIPIDAECISPDAFSGKSLDEVKNLKVLHGNEEKTLGDFFNVSGENNSIIEITGDVSKVKHIGTKMSCGKIIVSGNCGFHTGSEMTGGEIVVSGNAGDWTGAEMKGGIIRIKGNGGNFLGAGYRGAKKGMENGIIVVYGNTGDETGTVMCQGTIVIFGDAGSFLGANMTGGTIYCFGSAGDRTGAEMKDGTIVIYKNIKLLPTFGYNLAYNPVFLRAFLNELRKYEIPVEDKYITGLYKRYSGDLACSEKGEIFVYSSK